MKPFRHIVVPLDGSELAERALDPALKIAEAMAQLSSDTDESNAPVKVVLLRATTGPSLATADPFVYDTMLSASLDEAQEYLNQISGTLKDSAVVVETTSAPGPAAEAVVRYAEDNQADLIVLSSHGRTGSSRWVYGSVAEKVLHHAPCAVTIIRAQASPELFQDRAILVPLDGSELAETALAPAMNLASGTGAKIILLRVAVSPEPVADGLINRGAPSAEQRIAAEQQAREEALAYLQKVVEGLPQGQASFDVAVTIGDVADAIIDYAVAHQVGLIVVNSHGRSGLSRWLHGSVAEKVLRGAECATLIIRSPAG